MGSSMKRLLVLCLFLTACGQQGAQGIPGQSIVGPAGLNGTPITIVQFCPGVTPAYPTTFPEVGLCINEQIYAVYSANDGFLTEIPTGTYTSTAIGSACNFVVGPNCIVTPN
jgi:hypothetical protein